MLHIRNNSLKYILDLKYSCVTAALGSINISTCDNSVKSEDLSWSTGEKEKPWSKKLDSDDFGKTPWTKKRSLKDLLGLRYHDIDPHDATQKFPYRRADGGFQYLNFVYYPRFPDHQEPSVTPAALFMIKRRKDLNGCPWWEKDIMKMLGLHKRGRKSEKKRKIVFVKNIPEINGMLWRVKHLITITPVKLPDNVPDNANPLDYILTNEGEIKYRPGKVPYTEDELTTEVLAVKQIFDYEWVDDQTRKMYINSIDSDF